MFGEMLPQNRRRVLSLGKNGSAGMNCGGAVRQRDRDQHHDRAINHIPDLSRPNQTAQQWQINVDNWNITFGFRSRTPGGRSSFSRDGSSTSCSKQ